MRWTVLVVEDDDDVSDVVVEVLRDAGYEVQAARNGREALDLVHQGSRPCVIVLDLMMPVMDGFEFLEHRSHDPWLADVPVVVTTAQLERRPYASGVYATVPKPATMAHLLGTIRAALGDDSRPSR
jgi:two-component system, chemotaxis family, chemotaxis protein CheY